MKHYIHVPHNNAMHTIKSCSTQKKLELKKCIAVEKEEMQSKVSRFRNATGKSKAEMWATEGPPKCTKTRVCSPMASNSKALSPPSASGYVRCWWGCA